MQLKLLTVTDDVNDRALTKQYEIPETYTVSQLVSLQAVLSAKGGTQGEGRCEEGTRRGKKHPDLGEPVLNTHLLCSQVTTDLSPEQREVPDCCLRVLAGLQGRATAPFREGL